jgi:TRAP transporter TAXI family solute receptor
MSVIALRSFALSLARRTARWAAISSAVVMATAALAGGAAAQSYGFATLPPGTLNHTTASAVAKVLKEKAGMNVLVQPTAGDTAIIPMVNRGEAEIGITNILEAVEAIEGSSKLGKQPNLRLIGSPHTFRGGFWVRKDSPMKTVADLKGKKVPLGYSAMLTIDRLARAILMTGGLTEKDVVPVLVPNVVRGADDFVSGAADMYFFAFGAPKVREVDSTVGGTRILEINEKGMDAARKIFALGYLTPAKPSPFFVGVEKPMNVYAWDNLLITNDKVSDDVVYKIIDTLVKNKADLVAVQPALQELSAAGMYKQYGLPYHAGALKYFKENKIEPKPVM